MGGFFENRYGIRETLWSVVRYSWRTVRVLLLPLILGILVAYPPASQATTILPATPGESPGATLPELETGEARAWLDLGEVPGESATERRMAERVLLDMRGLVSANGAAIAAPQPGWDHVWPRDASWMAVAFCATGHHDEAFGILTFLASAQNPDGTWEARYDAASGAPILDGRRRQLDASGWFPWATWYWYVTAPAADQERVRALWPAARKSAGAAANSLGPAGLPPGGPDYWERTTWRPNLGTAAPMRTGLRAAADLASKLGQGDDAQSYAAAAVRLDAAIDREFAPHGYPRTTRPGSGADSAVTFLAPPFAPPDPRVEAAVSDAAVRLTLPNGGILPGEAWPHDRLAWTPETAFFALSAASSGDRARYLGWLAAHRTPAGAFPEKVTAGGEPASVAPLGWTNAIVLLALSDENKPLPIPPVPERPPKEFPPSSLLLAAGVFLGSGLLMLAGRRLRR